MKNEITNKVAAATNFLALILFCCIWATTGPPVRCRRRSRRYCGRRVDFFRCAGITVMERNETGKTEASMDIKISRRDQNAVPLGRWACCSTPPGSRPVPRASRTLRFRLVGAGRQVYFGRHSENAIHRLNSRGIQGAGKVSHEYRNAAEAMLRRLVKGSGLYRINNVVDINNLVSVSSGYSIGSYGISELHGPVTLRQAPEDTHYAGIGKDSVNIGFLPVLYDDEGPSKSNQRQPQSHDP